MSAVCRVHVGGQTEGSVLFSVYVLAAETRAVGGSIPDGGEDLVNGDHVGVVGVDEVVGAGGRVGHLSGAGADNLLQISSTRKMTDTALEIWKRLSAPADALAVWAAAATAPSWAPESWVRLLFWEMAPSWKTAKMTMTSSTNTGRVVSRWPLLVAERKDLFLSQPSLARLFATMMIVVMMEV